MKEEVSVDANHRPRLPIVVYGHSLVKGVVARMELDLAFAQGKVVEGWCVELAAWMPSDAEQTQRGSPASFRQVKFKVRNWAAYDAGLRRRGSLTLWVTDEAIAKWRAPPRLNPGGQAYYSDTAIETALMLRLTFHLPLRQTEGFMDSIFALLGVTVSAPDHSTLSRRAATSPPVSLGRMPEGPLHVLIDSTGLKVYGAGEWLQEKHGARARRSWRKLHLVVDAASGLIVAQTLTEKEIGDPSQVGPLLDQIQGDIEQVTADGAYDGAPTYRTIAEHGAHVRTVIPPHATAVLSDEAGQAPSQRDGHIDMIAAKGRLEWQKATGYGRRSLVETTMGRYKRIIGPQLRARSFAGQQTEVAIGIAVLNRMLEAGRPDSVRSFKKDA